jgi:hypothetical protein
LVHLQMMYPSKTNLDTEDVSGEVGV